MLKNTQKNSIKRKMGGIDEVEVEKENIVNGVPGQSCKRSKFSTPANGRDKRERGESTEDN